MKMRRLKLVALVMTLAMVISTASAFACTGAYVGKDVSEDGTTIIARSEDQGTGAYAKMFKVQPRVTKAGRYYVDEGEDQKGFKVPLPKTTYKYTYVPDVSTHGDGEYPASCTNEYGLAVVGTVSASPSEAYEAADPFKETGTGLREAILPGLIACQANGMLMFHAPLSLVRLFFGWTLFYTGGIWLRLHEKWQRCPLCVSVPVWLLSALGVLLTNHMFPSLSASSLRPDLLVYVFATWLMLWTLCSRCRTLPAPVRFIARHSFGLYLAHPMVLRLWNAWTVRQTPVIYLHLWQMFALALAGGLAIAVTLSYLPFGEYLGGAKRTKKILQRRA